MAEIEEVGEMLARIPRGKDQKIERLTKVAEEAQHILNAVTFVTPPKEFNGVMCWEARVPLGFVDGLRAAIAAVQPEEKHEPMGVHAATWCAACSAGKPMSEWVLWPCAKAKAAAQPKEESCD